MNFACSQEPFRDDRQNRRLTGKGVMTIREITVRMEHRDCVANEELVFDWNAYLLTENVALILEPEDEIVLISRVKLRNDGTYSRTSSGGFEIPIDLKTYVRIQSAPTELHALIAALAV